MYDQNASPLMVDVTRVPAAPRAVRRRAGLAPYFGPARIGALLLIAVSTALVTLSALCFMTDDPVAAIPRFDTTTPLVAILAVIVAWRWFLLPNRYRQLLRDGDVAVGRIIDRGAKIIERRGLSYGRPENEDPYHDEPTVYTLRYAFPVIGRGLQEATMRVGLGGL